MDITFSPASTAAFTAPVLETGKVAASASASTSPSLSTSSCQQVVLLLQQPYLLDGVVLVDHFWSCFEDEESDEGVEGDQEHVLVGHAD